MIMRVWKGSTTAADADAYHRYLQQTGLPGYRSTAGNLGATITRRIIDNRAEFLLMSFWESMEAVRAFAGDDPEVAVFYSEDDQFLIEKWLHVEHYDVLDDDLPSPA